jgi:GNAT superfamily N-acetyltransferase
MSAIQEWRAGVMSSGIIIRSAAEEDFDLIRDLYDRSIRSNPKGFIQDLTFHGCLIQKMQHWRDAGGDLLVAIAGGGLAGFGGLSPEVGGRVELCKLHVDSKWQRRGIGRLLATGLIRHACEAGFSKIVLHVTSTQTAAIALYQDLGFCEIGQKLFTVSVFGEPALFNTIYMSLGIVGDTAQLLQPLPGKCPPTEPGDMEPLEATDGAADAAPIL